MKNELYILILLTSKRRIRFKTIAKNFIGTHFTRVSISATFLGARNYRSGELEAHKWN
jgi:hypothetical protein